MRNWRKSPSVRLPHWPPSTVWMVPLWIACSPARTGAVNAGAEELPFSVCIRYRLQMPLVVASGPPLPPWFVPQVGSSGLAGAGVPYQATSTRPLSPAAAQAKTLLRSPGVGMVMGADQVVPSLVEKLYRSTVSPVMLPAESTGACSQTA